MERFTNSDLERKRIVRDFFGYLQGCENRCHRGWRLSKRSQDTSECRYEQRWRPDVEAGECIATSWFPIGGRLCPRNCSADADSCRAFRVGLFAGQRRNLEEPRLGRFPCGELRGTGGCRLGSGRRWTRCEARRKSARQTEELPEVNVGPRFMPKHKAISAEAVRA